MSSAKKTTIEINGISNDCLSKSEKMMRCAKCLNHGEMVPVKDHKNYCPWKECQCDKCSLIDERRRIMAAQVALRRRQCIEERLNKRNNHPITQNISDTFNENSRNNNIEERADEESKKNIWKTSQQLMTELYSMMGSEVLNEEIALSAAYALLKEKRNVNLTLSSIRNAGEELKKLRDSLPSNKSKIIQCEKTTISNESKERSLSGTESAQTHLSNYYYYQRMSPYYPKLCNFPSGTNFYPFTFHAQESRLQNFLSAPTLRGVHNSSSVDSHLNISSLSNSSNGHLNK